MSHGAEDCVEAIQQEYLNFIGEVERKSGLTCLADSNVRSRELFPVANFEMIRDALFQAVDRSLTEATTLRL